MKRKTYRAHIYDAADGWRWYLMAGNGHIRAHSADAYTTRPSAVRAVRALLDADIVFVDRPEPDAR